MDNKVATIPSVDFPAGPPAQRPEPADQAKAQQPSISSGADLRLVIEEDSGSGSYVYKTVDRRTGEVVQQYPQDDLLRMREQQAYVAGGVVNTTA